MSVNVFSLVMGIIEACLSKEKEHDSLGEKVQSFLGTFPTLNMVSLADITFPEVCLTERGPAT